MSYYHKKGLITMTNAEKIQSYRKKTIKELEDILSNPNSAESDIMIATIELQEKEEQLGIAVHYTTEEVLEHIFGQNRMVENC